jgi:salicylate hydroxylase
MALLPLDSHFRVRLPDRPLAVVVVGAGITGLTAAVAFAQAEHSVMVLEAATEIAEVGAGLQLAPNATRILRRLGLLDEVLECSTSLSKVSVR